DAYDRFIGANGPGLPGQNSGPGGLADILNEISCEPAPCGVDDPDVTMFVYNGPQSAAAVGQQALQVAQQSNGQNFSLAGGNLMNSMHNFFETVTVYIKTNETKDRRGSLKEVLGGKTPEIGWIRQK